MIIFSYVHKKKPFTLNSYFSLKNFSLITLISIELAVAQLTKPSTPRNW